MTTVVVSDLVATLPQGVPDALAPGNKVVVTGCAGFIGSHLTESLLALGCQVVGVDSLTDYYDPVQKRQNLASCFEHTAFSFQETDLLEVDLVALLQDATVCFHLAAQAGVRASWGDNFTVYLANNVFTTQRLLETCLVPAISRNLTRFVYSSSSSVYGDQTQLPVTERALPQPRSPYGVSKLAGEHLCVLYAANYGVPTSSLRYFTVYGPRQRPDMAFRKYIEKAFAREPFQVYGDGSQTRDFTYVEDAVRANILAIDVPSQYEVFNVGGGTRIALRDALAQLDELLTQQAPESPPMLQYETVAKGDVRDTYADRAHFESVAGYQPTVSFTEGLKRQVNWMLARRRRSG